VSKAIIYYAGQHYRGVPGYSRNAETNGGDSSDKEYCNRSLSFASSGNGGYQQLEGSRKRKSEEGKLLKYYLLFDQYDMIYLVHVCYFVFGYSYP